MPIMHIPAGCPSCGRTNSYNNIEIVDNHIRRKCNNCNYMNSLKLPNIKKKIIYLDQYFLSQLGKRKEQEWFSTASKKIEKLIKLQLLAVPHGDFHRKESLINNRRGIELFESIKSFCQYARFNPSNQIVHRQTMRHFQAFLSKNNLPIMLDEEDAIDRSKIHQWSPYFRINSKWYYDDIEIMAKNKTATINTLFETFNIWRKNKTNFKKNVNLEFADHAKSYLNSYCEYTGYLMAGDFAAANNCNIQAVIVQNMIESIQSLTKNTEEQLKIITDFFSSEYFNSLPHVFINSYIWAIIKNSVENGAYPDTAKKRDKLSGLVDDITHISTFSPYCDAYLIDNSMHSIVTDKRLNLDKRYNTKFFCRNNWSEFLEWLNQIESGITDEHKACIKEAYPNISP